MPREQKPHGLGCSEADLARYQQQAVEAVAAAASDQPLDRQALLELMEERKRRSAKAALLTARAVLRALGSEKLAAELPPLEPAQFPTAIKSAHGAPDSPLGIAQQLFADSVMQGGLTSFLARGRGRLEDWWGRLPDITQREIDYAASLYVDIEHYRRATTTARPAFFIPDRHEIIADGKLISSFSLGASWAHVGTEAELCSRVTGLQLTAWQIAATKGRNQQVRVRREIAEHLKELERVIYSHCGLAAGKKPRERRNESLESNCYRACVG